MRLAVLAGGGGALSADPIFRYPNSAKMRPLYW